MKLKALVGTFLAMFFTISMFAQQVIIREGDRGHEHHRRHHHRHYHHDRDRVIIHDEHR